MARVTAEQALAWRMGRHFLDPITTPRYAEIVSRLCGVQAQVASSAELAIRVRRATSRSGHVDRMIERGDLIRTWAMRGTLHLLTPTGAGKYLSLLAWGRSWERPSWQRHFGMTPRDIDALRDAVAEVLAGRVLTRKDLVAELTRRPELADAASALESSWGTLFKPVAWQGLLCQGPKEGNESTFRLPGDTSPGWTGLPPPEEAAPAAILSYLAVYGPAGFEPFGKWLAGGWFGTRQLRAWFDDLGDSLVEVDLDGDAAFIPAEHLDDLMSASPTGTVRLLPGFDQWVLGPTTSDSTVIPPGRRNEVSRTGGWISPVVLRGGVVCGSWKLQERMVSVSWFGEAGTPPMRELTVEVARLDEIIGGGDLSLQITVT